ncbi:MAG: helix-turn-helix domain-containing protein [Burkholderiaceae bacterium]|jgi:cytoskeleton protein RodZ|nr:helix-turn-helix domain-containing protein [Burkholderiaceae bacterium]
MNEPMNSTDPSTPSKILSAAEQLAAGPAEGVDEAEALSAGALLRQWRQAAGVDPSMLASALKVAPQKILALEEDRLGDLPNLTFARSLASAICRFMGADPAPVLARMPSIMPEQLQAGPEARREPFNAGAGNSVGGLTRLRLAAGVPRWLLALIVLLLLGALVVKFLPVWHLKAAVGPQSVSGTVASATEAAAQAAEAASEGAVAEAASQASQSASALAPALAPQAASAAASAPATAASVAAPAASGPDVAASGGGVEHDVVTFTAMDSAWISVRDGDGKLLLSRTLTAGEEVSEGGALPLSVVIGDKENVIVTVRGHLLDLNPYTRSGSTVAKFTVGPAPQNQ